jgi:hypothetical protein
MTDTTSTDLGPFFKRYDRRNRLFLATAFAASLALSAVIAAHMLTAAGVKGAAVLWGAGVVSPPLGLAAWWIFGEVLALGRRRASPPDGSHPVGASDARDGVRIANAGFAFNVVFAVTVTTGQLLMALLLFGVRAPGDLIARATLAAMGAVTIYLGNLWPRMPTPRAPEQRAATRMKANRSSGWLMVIVGLLVILLGLFLPLLYPFVRSLPRP